MSDSTDHSALAPRIKAACAAVLRQVPRLNADLGNVKSDWKADGSRVTETDLAISQGILGELAAAFPEDQGFSEELMTGEPIEVTSRYSWVLDPIDGTNNFAVGLAQCAISLALLEKGRPVYGVIFDVSRQRLMHGGRDRGVWDGEEKVTALKSRLNRSSKVGFHSPREEGKYPGHGEAIVARCKVRAIGSSALHLAYVAAGFLDGVVDHNVKVWDIAAAVAMVEAGGAEVRFLAHDPFPLRRFDLDMPASLYVAGGAQMCDDLEAVLPAKGA
ncbi:inositol monophosphatase [bacterium]|jgi:myo-inositol-1(or 4)-monophosphatase|nr:inositol monophosphatase [bacterium]